MLDLQTIPQAFAAWTDTAAHIYTAASEDAWGDLISRRNDIEDAAVALPVRTPGEIWQLLAMVARPHSDMTTATEHLLRRAQAEASVVVANSSRLKLLFDHWLPIAEAAQMPDATDEQIQCSIALAREAIWLTADDPLDIWRKVAMVLDITDRFHTGPSAALLREAGAALGVETKLTH